MYSQLNFAKGALAQRTDDLVGTDALLCLLLRRWLNGTVVVAIWTARAGIGRFVVCATICGGSKRDLELAIFVGPVRHHCGVCCCFWREWRNLRGGNVDGTAPPLHGPELHVFNTLEGEVGC